MLRKPTLYDVLVARTADIDIRYTVATDRILIVDHMTGEILSLTGEILSLTGDLIIEAADAIEVLKHSAL